MNFKDVGEAVGFAPAIVAYLKPLPTWFKPTDYLEPNVTLAAVAVSAIACISTWVFFAAVDDPVKDWPKDKRVSVFRLAIIMLVAALIDMIAYVLIAELYPYPNKVLNLAQTLLWAAFFGLLSLALTIFVVLQKDREPKTE
jgi:hypothetical protein